jgi:hypothetical protein
MDEHAGELVDGRTRERAGQWANARASRSMDEHANGARIPCAGRPLHTSQSGTFETRQTLEGIAQLCGVALHDEIGCASIESGPAPTFVGGVDDEAHV